MQQDRQTSGSFDSVETVLTFRPGKGFFETASYMIGVPDADRALEQHRNYCSAISQCGADVVSVPENNWSIANKLAVITDSFAIMANYPEGSKWQSEVKNAATLLATRRFLKFITAPGLLDASDVLRADNRYFINLSANTNEEGAAQLAYFLMESGYEVEVINELSNASPLDNRAVYLGNNMMLIEEDLALNYSFISYDKIIVSAEEKGAANALMVNGTLVMSVGFAKTAQSLKEAGIKTVQVNISELAKTGIGIKCLSLAMPSIPKYGEISINNWEKKAA